jgi:PIN domain nuclease of toxin-antitoxin system
LGILAVILLGTHVWIWHVAQRDRLSLRHRKTLDQGPDRHFVVSIISCWEIAKLAERERLKLDRPVLQWMEESLAALGTSPVPLSPSIVVESTCLPSPFHRDPADQLLVATARVLGCEIMSEDSKIVDYPHVRHA